ATQLDATADVPGTFAYSPAAGTLLAAGTQTLSVTFTPADPADYHSASTSVTLRVGKATPTVIWADPAPITFGALLSDAQLDAAAHVPGRFVYSPATGTLLGLGTHALAVAFTPADTADYSPVTQATTLLGNPPPVATRPA